jgi:hypothetical protein
VRRRKQESRGLLRGNIRPVRAPVTQYGPSSRGRGCWHGESLRPRPGALSRRPSRRPFSLLGHVAALIEARPGPDGLTYVSETIALALARVVPGGKPEPQVCWLLELAMSTPLKMTSPQPTPERTLHDVQCIVHEQNSFAAGREPPPSQPEDGTAGAAACVEIRPPMSTRRAITRWRTSLLRRPWGRRPG